MLTRPVCEIMNRIKQGRKMPQGWVERTSVHIYNKKREIDDFASYRPICMAKIIYQLWSQLLTRKLMEIIHMAAKNEFRIQNISTIDPVLKIESRMANSPPETHLPLMGLAKAFYDVRRQYSGQRYLKKERQ